MGYTVTKDDVVEMEQNLSSEPATLIDQGADSLLYVEEDFTQSLGAMVSLLEKLQDHEINSSFLYAVDFDFVPHIVFQHDDQDPLVVHIWARHSTFVVSTEGSNFTVGTVEEVVSILIEYAHIS